MGKVHPDSSSGNLLPNRDPGWRVWAAIPASFLVHVVTCGLGYSAGVYYFRLRYQFGGNHMLTSCVGSMLLAMMAIAGILSTVIVYKLGYRASIIIGGLLAATGFAATSLAEQLYHLYFTIGITSGIGLGLAMTPAVMVIESLFHKYPEVCQTASSVALSGTGIGVLFIPLSIYKLDEAQDWKGLMYGLAGISGVIALCGFIYVPHKEACHRRDVVRVFELSLLKSTSFMMLCVSNFMWSVGASIIYIHLPSFAVSTGLTIFDGVMLICITGIATFASRAMFQILSHSAKLDTISTSLCTICLTVILTGIFPELFKNKAGQIGYAIMFGMHSGYWTTFVSSTASDLIGDVYLAVGKGFLALSIGLGLGIGAPLAGWIIDYYEDYQIIFYLAGACLLASSVIMVALNFKGSYFRPGIGDSSDFDSLSTSKSFKGSNDDLLISSKETAV